MRWSTSSAVPCQRNSCRRPHLRFCVSGCAGETETETGRRPRMYCALLGALGQASRRAWGWSRANRACRS